MKKLSFLFITAFLYFTVDAQLTFGPRAGANIAKQNYGDSYIKTSYHVFPNVGIFVNYGLGKHFQLEAEALYSAEGTKFYYYTNVINNTASKTEGVITNNYINIPLLLKYKLPVGVYFESGPQVGLLLSAHQKYAGTLKQDVKDRTQSLVIGWSLGAGYNLHTLLPGLSADIRYTAGITSATKGSSIKGNAFTLAFAYAVSSHKRSTSSNNKHGGK